MSTSSSRSSALYTAAAGALLALAACGPEGATDGQRDSSPGEEDGPDCSPGTWAGSGEDDLGDQDEGLDAGCSVDDLVWTAEVQDAYGWPVTAVTAGADITLVGRVENPCDEDVIVDVHDACLVVGFEVLDSLSGTGDYAELSCPLAGAGVRLRAGEVEEARYSWQDMPAGAFDLTVHFALDLDVSVPLTVE